MIKLNKIYSEPEIFEPIEFLPGVNLILGETIEDSNKTIGVGKSLCIEFLNFCLLKQYKHSRISRIPKEKLLPEIDIILELDINKNSLKILRSIEKPDNPRIINSENKTIEFSNIEDANNYLTELLFEKKVDKTYPSFRELMGPLLRDERSEFKDILQCYDTDLRIPPQYNSNLYFFDIDIEVYKKLKQKFDQIEIEGKHIYKLTQQITNNKSRKLSDVRSELNEINTELKKINAALDSLKTNEAFDSIQNDIIKLENDIEESRRKKKYINHEIERILSLPKPEDVDENDIKILYNKFKDGLGDQILKSFTQVKEFKSRIEKFQNSLINERLENLKNDLEIITKQLRIFDSQYSEKIKLLDTRGELKDLKTSFSIYNKKNEETARIRGLFKELEDAQTNKKELTLLKDELILKLDSNVKKIEKLKESFNETVLDVHNFIMGNNRASFQISVLNENSRKEIINFELRIYDDGSHSIDRLKVFIYDISLLFNDSVRIRHPKLLVHDNIFDVDQDSLVKSLNYLAKQETLYNDFQYILTLNRDKIQNEEEKHLLNLDIDKHKIATFTKLSKFLGFDYQEI